MKRGTLSQNLPYDIRPQIPPRMDDEVPQAGAHRQSSPPRPRPHTRNMQNPQYTNPAGACVQRPHPPFHLHAAADISEQDCPVYQRQDITETAPRAPAPAAAVLGTACLGGEGLLCRELRRHH